MCEGEALADKRVRTGCSERKEGVLPSKGGKLFWVERRSCAKTLGKSQTYRGTQERSHVDKSSEGACPSRLSWTWGEL